MFHVEHFEGWIEVLKEGADALDVSLRDYTITQFAVYLRELKSWNEKINLTAILDDKEIVIKHFIDSMAACRVLLPLHDFRLLDIGSGAGFPGFVLKLMIPDLHVTLLEPSKKRVAFLRHLIGKLHLKDIEVIDQRIDEFAMRQPPPDLFPWATIRALSVTPLLGPISCLLAENGKLLLYRTRLIDKKLSLEIASHKFIIIQQYQYNLIQEYGSRVLSVIQKVSQPNLVCG
jgi:16S rRNA (guanine527-N7)-methyltransferase